MCVRMCVVLNMDIGRGRSFLGPVTEKIQSPGYKTRQNWWAWSSFLEDLLFLSSCLPEPWFSVPCGKQTMSPGQQLAVAMGAGSSAGSGGLRTPVSNGWLWSLLRSPHFAP